MQREKDGLIMNYDIASKESALESLKTLTGLDSDFWIKNSIETPNIEIDDLIEKIQSAKGVIPNLENIDCIFYHITTSCNGCKSITNDGLNNLETTYKNENSELRQFLDKHNIMIRWDYQCLTHNENYFSIEFEKGGEVPLDHNGIEYYGWLIGRKLYWDKGICGFYHISKNDPYLTGIHKHPEIIADIERLLKIGLIKEWDKKSKPYVVTSKVNALNIERESYITNNEMVKKLIFKAFDVFCGCDDNKILLCRTDINLSKKDILGVEELHEWN